jgi:hypothetical protein
MKVKNKMKKIENMKMKKMKMENMMKMEMRTSMIIAQLIYLNGCFINSDHVFVFLYCQILNIDQKCNIL